MKFSVVIPVYNVATHIRDCLDSLVSQSFTDWEAVCVDDGSTDGSGLVLDEYAAKDSRFVVVHQPNAGVGAARNRALDLAKGEWLLFADADDAWVDGAFSEILQRIQGNRYDAFFFDKSLRFVDRIPQSFLGSGCEFDAIQEISTGKRLLLGARMSGHPWRRVLRRSIFGDVKFPVGVPMMEDDINLVETLAKRARWVRVDLCVYAYRVRPESASNVYRPGSALGVLNVCRRCYANSMCLLGCTRDEAYKYVNAKRDVMQLYLMKAVRDEDARGYLELARTYFEYERETGRPMINVFHRLRLRIFYCLHRRVGFAMIGFAEYVFHGVRNRICATKKVLWK